MSTTNRKLRVFLCHASQDKPVVRELYQRLLAEGWIDPWLDEEKLLPGQDWDMEIEKAVETSDAVIVCISNNSISKEGYIQKEMKFVLDIALEKPEGTIFIIPLRLDEIQPPRRLRSWQYVDYFPSDQKDWAFSRLVASLDERKRNFGAETVPLTSISPVLGVFKPHVKQGYFKIGGVDFALISEGKSVVLKREDQDDFRLLIVDIPYQFWIARSLISNFEYNHQYDVSAEQVVPLSRDSVTVSYQDAEKFVRYANDKYQNTLPPGYVFSIPSQSELIRAVVLKNLNYHKGEWTRIPTPTGVFDHMWKSLALYAKRQAVFRLVLIPPSRIGVDEHWGAFTSTKPFA
jgi:hypothetical protein